MVTLRLKVKIDPDKRHEFIQSLTAMGFATDQNQGLRMAYQSLADENLFCCYEDWGSKAELDQYLASQEYSVFVGAIKVLGGIEESCVLESPPGEGYQPG
jgi:quinol monooxygenase YgiN